MAKFSFKEMLKGIKKRDSSTSLEPISLGEFPISVHKLWRARNRGWTPSPKPLTSSLGKNIAICLTVVDSLPHEDLWKKWLDSAKFDRQGRSGSMHIHAKFPDKIKKQQPWVGERTLSHSYVPEWNDVKVVRAMIALLRDALRDQGTAFIFLGTESCVPIAPFVTVAERLFSEGATSWINCWPDDPPSGSGLKRPSKFESSSQFAVVDDQMVPPGAVWKALPGWITLTRHHAEAIVNIEERVGGELWPAFSRVFAPEEMYFPTALCLAGHSALPYNGEASEIRVQSLVFAQYPKSGPNTANPIALDDSFDTKTLHKMRKDGFLFVRKFKRPLSPTLQEAILSDEPDVSQAEVSLQPPKTDRYSRRSRSRSPKTDRYPRRSRSRSPKTDRYSQRPRSRSPKTDRYSRRSRSRSPKTDRYSRRSRSRSKTDRHSHRPRC